jgi:hypothetical protein
LSPFSIGFLISVPIVAVLARVPSAPLVAALLRSAALRTLLTALLLLTALPLTAALPLLTALTTLIRATPSPISLLPLILIRHGLLL